MSPSGVCISSPLCKRGDILKFLGYCQHGTVWRYLFDRGQCTKKLPIPKGSYGFLYDAVFDQMIYVCTSMCCIEEKQRSDWCYKTKCLITLKSFTTGECEIF